MRKYVSERDAFALGLMALGARLFFAIAIDLRGMLNAGWIEALAACALTLPLAFCLRYLGKSWAAPPAERFTAWPARLFAALLALLSVYEAGSVLRLFALSAQQMALEGVSVWLLMPLLALSAAIGCLSGAQAVGAAARISLMLLALFLAIIIAVQIPSMNIRWLTPVLGPGVRSLALPLPYLAGLMTGLVQLWLLKGYSDTAPKKLSMPVLVIAVGVVCAVLLALFSMLAPLLVGVPETRAFWLDRLLTNGRVSVSLQLVIVLTWYMCMMMTLAFSLITACTIVRIVIPAAKLCWASPLCALAALAVPLLNLADRPIIAWVLLVRWPVVTLPIMAAALLRKIRSGKGKPA